jgi:hypothetical protein
MVAHHFYRRMIFSENRLPLFGIMLNKASASIWFKSRLPAITFRRNSEWIAAGNTTKAALSVT